jgi:hypothetical protein
MSAVSQTYLPSIIFNQTLYMLLISHTTYHSHSVRFDDKYHLGLFMLLKLYEL